MQTFSVLSPVGNAFDVIATLTPKGETFSVKFTRRAIATGWIFSPSMRHDFIRAALFLCAESAAVSLVCHGYTIAKV